MPIPPAKLRYKVGEDFDPDVFVQIGRATAARIRELLDEYVPRKDAARRVLDFGCGCGRTLYWLATETGDDVWLGSDTDAEAIGWCRRVLPAVRTMVNSQGPPLDLPESYLDAIYGISVFTHLDEMDQRRWLAEFHRVLKPGGVVILSFYSEAVWKEDPNAERIRSGEFVFKQSRKLSGIHPDWYQTAMQSRTRIESLVSALFRVEYLQHGLGAHDLVVGVKPAQDGSPRESGSA